MEGFTDKGLVILPDKEIYNNLPDAGKSRFLESLELLPQVFKSNYGIKLFYLNTNVIYDVTMPADMEEIFCLCRGDIDFLNGIAKSNESHELVCSDKGQFKKDEYNDLRTSVQKKYPVENGMAQNKRVDVIEKREQRLAGLIAQRFSLIITFEKQDKRRYEIKTRKLEGRIVLEINPVTLIAKGFLAGEVIDIISVMDRPWAFKPIYQWEAVRNDIA